MSSLVSANGPSTTVRLAPENFTRAPAEDGFRPSPARMTPALTSSSLNLPMSASSFASGIAPASDSLLALTMTITRMSILRLSKGRDAAAPVSTTDGMAAFRHAPQ